MIDHTTPQEKLAEHARILGGARDDRLPLDRIAWTYDELFPVARFLEIMSFEEWKKWFDEELEISVEVRGSDEAWRCLLTEEIEEELIILDHEGLDIWDGWHRAAAMVLKGQEYAKVVRGEEKKLEIGLAMRA